MSVKVVGKRSVGLTPSTYVVFISSAVPIAHEKPSSVYLYSSLLHLSEMSCSVTVSIFVVIGSISLTDPRVLTVKSEGAAECKQTAEAVAVAARLSPNVDENDARSVSDSSDRKFSA